MIFLTPIRKESFYKYHAQWQFDEAKLEEPKIDDLNKTTVKQQNTQKKEEESDGKIGLSTSSSINDKNIDECLSCYCKNRKSTFVLRENSSVQTITGSFLFLCFVFFFPQKKHRIGK